MVPKNRAMSTRVLLTCAAIGVATGLISGGAGYISYAVSSLVPIIYGLILGAHVLPGVVAQALLRLPGVAIITHVLAALIGAAIAPNLVFSLLGGAILFGGIQEGIAALARYRRWGTWRFVISAVVIGLFIAAPIAIVTDATRFEPWAFVTYIALFIAGPVVWTLIGLSVGSALRRAGVSAQPTQG